ncbi:hypothetical protein D3C81_2300600 [compost metagenome]
MTLDELVSAKYLRKVPLDPVTDSNRTWIVIPPDDAQKGGAYNVLSGAGGRARDGSAYRDW